MAYTAEQYLKAAQVARERGEADRASRFDAKAKELSGTPAATYTADQYMKAASKAREMGQEGRARRFEAKALADFTGEGTALRSEYIQTTPVQTGETLEEAREKALTRAKRDEFKRTPERQAEIEAEALQSVEDRTKGLVSPGRKMDAPAEPGLLDRFGEVLDTARKYYAPESTESIGRVLERQPTMTAEALQEARARAQEAQAAGETATWVDYLPEALRLSTQGVETPTGAALRVLGDTTAGAVEVAAREALTYEVDEQGNPVDPDDLSYKLRKAKDSVSNFLREEAGINIDIETPSGMGVLGPLGYIPVGDGKILQDAQRLGLEYMEDRSGLELPDALKGLLVSGITMPKVGTPLSRERGEANPYGLKDAPVSGTPIIDQVIRNARVGRTMTNLFDDMPELKETYEKSYGSDSIPQYVGLGLDVLVPGVPGVTKAVTKPALKAAKEVAGMAAPRLALRNIAAKRVFGDDVVKAALETDSDVVDVIAREATGPAAILRAAKAGETATRTAQDIAPGSRSAQWVYDRARKAGVSTAYAEMRIAQRIGDITQVWATEGREAALQVMKAAGKGHIPATIERLTEGSITDFARAMDELVPRQARVLGLGMPQFGKASRAALLVGDSGEFAKTRSAVQRVMGQYVPRDLSLVTSRVALPSNIAAKARKLVHTDLRGAVKSVGEGLYSVDAQKALEAITRFYPGAETSDYWRGIRKALQAGENFSESDARRITDLLQSDAYMRLSKYAEVTPNVGAEFDKAVATSLMGHISSTVSGLRQLFKKAPDGAMSGAYATYAKRIADETRAIASNFKRDMTAAKEAVDPWLDVGTKYKDEAGRFADNYVEEAWQEALNQAFGPRARALRDIIRKDAPEILEDVPGLVSFDRVQELYRGSDLFVGEFKDVGSALSAGHLEARKWTLTRNILREFMDDNPTMVVTLVKGADTDLAKAKAHVADALTDFAKHGHTYVVPESQTSDLAIRAVINALESAGIDPITARNLARNVDTVSIADDALEKQRIYRAVGANLRRLGVEYTSNLSDKNVAARTVDNMAKYLREMSDMEEAMILPPTEQLLKLFAEPDSLGRLSEGVEVLAKAGDHTAYTRLQLIPRMITATTQALQTLRPGSLAKEFFGTPINMLSTIGLDRSMRVLFGAPAEVISTVGKGPDDVLFSAGGRDWTMAAIDNAFNRLGVGEGSKMKALRSGRYEDDLLKSINRYRSGASAKRVGNLSFVTNIMDTTDKIYRKGLFMQLLKKGLSPEESLKVVRESLLDFDPQSAPAFRTAATHLAHTYSSMLRSQAAIRNLIERPDDAVRIMRLLRAQDSQAERLWQEDTSLTETHNLPFASPKVLESLINGAAGLRYGDTSFADVVTDISPESARRILSSFEGQIEGEAPSLTKEEEDAAAMLMAQYASRHSPEGWAMVADYLDMEEVNVSPEGKRTRVPVGRMARIAPGARGEEVGPISYAMTPQGRARFRKLNFLGYPQFLLSNFVNDPQLLLATTPESELETVTRRVSEAIIKETGLQPRVQTETE